MNEEMLQCLDAKEREAKLRRISCTMHVPRSKTDAIVTRIHELHGRLGFDAKLNRHCDLEPGEVPHDIIDVWCDATPDVLKKFLLKGFDAIATSAVHTAMETRISAKSTSKIGPVEPWPDPERTVWAVFDFDDRSPPSSRSSQ